MKCIHCGNETELGNVLSNGDRVYPLHYPPGIAKGYVDLVTSVRTLEYFGLKPGTCIRLEVEMPYIILTIPMLRQMIQDIENAS